MSKKIYIIITYDIHPIGGAQVYTAGKSRYLESIGWNVMVLFDGDDNGVCHIPYLNKYLCGGCRDLHYLPYNLHKKAVDFIVEEIIINMIDRCGDDKIIIESHYDVAAFWGELLAEKLNCKHYIFCVNEYYRNKNGYVTHYKENLDFFYFKFKRNELIASNESIRKLFNGYKGVTQSQIDFPDLIVEPNPVQDIVFKTIDSLPQSEWNICIISRMEKPFVKYAVKGVRDFSVTHSSSQINLIFIGDESPIVNYLYELFNHVDNVRFFFWGVLVPIPRIIFKKIDVVIAVAQTARLISYETVYVITANVLTAKTSGVLGYDTQDSWYGEEIEGRNYEDVLEDVLVVNKYKKFKFSMPELKPAEYYYGKQWEYFGYSSSIKDYFTMRLKEYRNRNWVALFPFWKIPPKARVIIYGAGIVGENYISQIETTNYCDLVAVLDGRCGEFDSSVCSSKEGLKMDFDIVVIATLSDKWAKQMIDEVKENTVGKIIIHDIKIVWS